MNVLLRLMPASSKRMTFWLKFFFCLYNQLFLVLSVILVVLGALGATSLQVLGHLTSTFSVYVQMVFIVSGAALMAFSLLGIVAAIISSTWMLRLFSLCVSVMFLAELTSGIVGFIYRTEVKRLLSRAFRDAQKQYTGNDASSHIVDSIQVMLSCCGHAGFSDWGNVSYFQSRGLPGSCCINKDECPSDVLTDLNKAHTQVHKIGCVAQLSQVLMRSMGAAAGVSIGIGLFQCVGVLLACCLTRYITHSFLGMPL